MRPTRGLLGIGGSVLSTLLANTVNGALEWSAQFDATRYTLPPKIDKTQIGYYDARNG